MSKTKKLSLKDTDESRYKGARTPPPPSLYKEPVVYASPILTPTIIKTIPSPKPMFPLQYSPLGSPLSSVSPLSLAVETPYPPAVRALNTVGRYHYYTVCGSTIRENSDYANIGFSFTASSLDLPTYDPAIITPSATVATASSSSIATVVAAASSTTPPPLVLTPPLSSNGTGVSSAVVGRPLHCPQEELTAEELKLASDVLGRINSKFLRGNDGEYAWVEEPVHPFTVEKLCRCVQRVLYRERSLIDLGSCGAPVCVFGDIHGGYRDLRRFADLLGLERAGQSKMKYLFLGDYVDRGPHPVEVVVYLFALKVLFPNQVFLLSGNHEHVNYLVMRDPAGTYRLFKDVTKVYGKARARDVYTAMVNAFSVLPWAATIDGEVFCSHGGFPRYSSEEELAATLERMRTESPLADPYYEVFPAVPFQDVMYSDPIFDDKQSGSDDDGGGGGSGSLLMSLPSSVAERQNEEKDETAPNEEKVVKTATKAISTSEKKPSKGKKKKGKEKKSLSSATPAYLFPNGFCKNTHRKGRDDFPCSFSKEAFEGFCRVAKVGYLIRAHQHFDGCSGLRFSKRLFTIFTSTDLFEIDNKKSGQAVVYYGKAFHVIVLTSEQALIKS